MYPQEVVPLLVPRCSPVGMSCVYVVPPFTLTLRSAAAQPGENPDLLDPSRPPVGGAGGPPATAPVNMRKQLGGLTSSTPSPAFAATLAVRDSSHLAAKMAWDGFCGQAGVSDAVLSNLDVSPWAQLTAVAASPGVAALFQSEESPGERMACEPRPMLPMSPNLLAVELDLYRRQRPLSGKGT